jgi:hypothetical protein
VAGVAAGLPEGRAYTGLGLATSAHGRVIGRHAGPLSFVTRCRSAVVERRSMDAASSIDLMSKGFAGAAADIYHLTSARRCARSKSTRGSIGRSQLGSSCAREMLQLGGKASETQLQRPLLIDAT